jgi:calcineurin-like phosphoesterase family protein
MNENPTKYYLLADPHWNHYKMVEYCNRPSNFDQLIINHWQATIHPQDIVFVLGDVTWGSQGQLKTVMNGLPGTKILIRGNHDRNNSNNWFIKAGFAVVLEKAQVCGVILSHFPAILNDEEIKRDIINVHGHFHNNPAKKWEKHLTEKITKNHYLLSLEEVNYTPVSLEQVKRKKFVKNSKKLLDSESKI